MASDPFLALGVVLAVAVLAAGGVSLLRYRRGVGRQQRQGSWRELCLRLELTPQPGRSQVAKGELQNTDFYLHDTGADWLLELPLAHPLLPPGMVLTTPQAPRLPPRVSLRPLEWKAASLAPGMRAWSADPEQAFCQLEAPQAFHEEATRAMLAHAPLRVESRRFIQALRMGDLLSVSEVREAVRALHATARGWLEVAESHGLPRVQPLQSQPPPALPDSQEVQAPQPSPPEMAASPEPPWDQAPRPSPPEVAPMPEFPWEQAPRLWRKASSALEDVLERHEFLRLLCLLNVGIPLSLFIMSWSAKKSEESLAGFACFAMPLMMIIAAWVDWGRYSRWQVTMILSTNFAAPLFWMSGQGKPALYLWGVPNLWVLGQALWRWFRK